MPSCCDSTTHKVHPSPHHRCPGGEHDGSAVALNTVLQHLKAPWLYPNLSANHYYCSDPYCPVIYFTGDTHTANSVIDQSQLRTEVGIKSASPQRSLCYCYGVSAAQADADPAIRDFVTEQTKQKNCACDVRNPSGRCCLNTFPKPANRSDG